MTKATQEVLHGLTGLVSVLFANNLFAQSLDTIQIPDVGSCKLVGTAKQDNLKELNRLKNRYTFPPAEKISPSITLSDILKPGDDADRWESSKAIEVVGYVIDVQPGGVETCNCKTKDNDYKDTHIAIVNSETTTDKTEAVVVEVTPRVRILKGKEGTDWSTGELQSLLVGHWVRIQGWMLFDSMHSSQSENTNPGNASDWRATAWEIHPITGIEVISRPMGAAVSNILRTLAFRPKPVVIVDRPNSHAYVSIRGQTPYPLLATVEVEDDSE